MDETEKKQETGAKQPVMPLSIILENAKGKMADAINGVLQETQLPPSLAEGILDGVMSDLRRQKNLELITDMNRYNEEKGKAQN